MLGFGTSFFFDMPATLFWGGMYACTVAAATVGLRCWWCGETEEPAGLGATGRLAAFIPDEYPTGARPAEA